MPTRLRRVVFGKQGSWIFNRLRRVFIQATTCRGILCCMRREKTGGAKAGRNFWQRFFDVRLRPELRELYSFQLFFAFASALVTIFEPVFFYQQGIDFPLIALYYAVHYSLYVVLLPLGGKFAARFGLERSLALSLPIFIAYFLALAAMPDWPSLFWVALGLLTVHKIFYWPAYYAEFSKYGDQLNRGTELSWMLGLTTGIGILGPLFGGIIAVYAGFPVLFLVAAGVTILASLPLLRTQEEFAPVTFAYSAPWRIIGAARHRGMVVAMLGKGEELVDMFFWPLFMFIILGSADRLGFTASFSLALASLFGFFIGEMSDRFPRRRVIQFNLPFLLLAHLFRVIAVTPLRVVLTELLARLSTVGVLLPLSSHLYAQGRRYGALTYSIAFEIMLAYSKALMAWVLVGLFLWLEPGGAFTAAFVLAGLLGLLYGKIR